MDQNEILHLPDITGLNLVPNWDVDVLVAISKLKEMQNAAEEQIKAETSAVATSPVQIPIWDKSLPPTLAFWCGGPILLFLVYSIVDAWRSRLAILRLLMETAAPTWETAVSHYSVRIPWFYSRPEQLPQHIVLIALVYLPMLAVAGAYVSIVLFSVSYPLNVHWVIRYCMAAINAICAYLCFYVAKKVWFKSEPELLSLGTATGK